MSNTLDQYTKEDLADMIADEQRGNTVLRGDVERLVHALDSAKASSRQAQLDLATWEGAWACARQTVLGSTNDDAGMNNDRVNYVLSILDCNYPTFEVKKP